MRRIQLKVVPVDGENDLSYKEHLVTLAEIPMDQQKGVGIEEMRKSVRLLDKIEQAPEEGFIDLEDADFEFLKQKLEKVTFKRTSRELLQFLDDVLASEQISPAAEVTP